MLGQPSSSLWSSAHCEGSVPRMWPAAARRGTAGGTEARGLIQSRTLCNDKVQHQRHCCPIKAATCGQILTRQTGSCRHGSGALCQSLLKVSPQPSFGKALCSDGSMLTVPPPPTSRAEEGRPVGPPLSSSAATTFTAGPPPWWGGDCWMCPGSGGTSGCPRTPRAASTESHRPSEACV